MHRLNFPVAHRNETAAGPTQPRMRGPQIRTPLHTHSSPASIAGNPRFRTNCSRNPVVNQQSAQTATDRPPRDTTAARGSPRGRTAGPSYRPGRSSLLYEGLGCSSTTTRKPRRTATTPQAEVARAKAASSSQRKTQNSGTPRTQTQTSKRTAG